MYAVFSTGGKQYRAVPGEVVRVESIAADVDSEIKLDQVHMVGDGDNIKIGGPFISGAHITAKIRSHGRGEKIRIIKFRRRKHFRKETGHRQNYTEIEILGIKGL